jgi:hypothetical protein
MQRSSRGLWRSAKTIVVGAVVVAALVWFYPNAWGALAATIPPLVVAADSAGHTTPSAIADLAVLDEFHETQSLAAALKTIARDLSKHLNDELRKERAFVLALRRAGDRSLEAAIAQQEFDAIALQRNAWDRQWRQIGRKGANLNRVQNNLFQLMNRFRDLLVDLREHWRVERRTGVVSPFDFPDL